MPGARDLWRACRCSARAAAVALRCSRDGFDHTGGIARRRWCRLRGVSGGEAEGPEALEGGLELGRAGPGGVEAQGEAPAIRTRWPAACQAGIAEPLGFVAAQLAGQAEGPSPRLKVGGDTDSSNQAALAAKSWEAKRNSPRAFASLMWSPTLAPGVAAVAGLKVDDVNTGRVMGDHLVAPAVRV